MPLIFVGPRHGKYGLLILTNTIGSQRVSQQYIYILQLSKFMLTKYLSNEHRFFFIFQKKIISKGPSTIGFRHV